MEQCLALVPKELVHDVETLPTRLIEVRAKNGGSGSGLFGDILFSNAVGAVGARAHSRAVVDDLDNLGTCPECCKYAYDLFHGNITDSCCSHCRISG